MLNPEVQSRGSGGKKKQVTRNQKQVGRSGAAGINKLFNFFNNQDKVNFRRNSINLK